MASINLKGVLREPLGEASGGNKIIFTHVSTTGEVIAGSMTKYTVVAGGSYDINIEYGNVNVMTSDLDSRSWQNHGTMTINQDTAATTLPTLLNSAVPPTDAQIILFQDLVQDAIDASDASEASAVRSETAAQTSIDNTILMAASERKAIIDANEEKYAASGQIHTGKHGSDPINEGLYTDTSTPNILKIGGGDNGTSKTKNAVFHMAGSISELSVNDVLLPPQPKGYDVYDSTGDCRGSGKATLNLRTEDDPKYGDTATTYEEATARAFEGSYCQNGDGRFGDTTGWGVQGAGSTIANNGGIMAFDVGSNSGNSYLVCETRPEVLPSLSQDLILEFEVVACSQPSRFGYVQAFGTELQDPAHLLSQVGKHKVTFRPTAQTGDLRWGTYSSSQNTTLEVRNIRLHPATEEVVTDRVDMFGLEQFDMVMKDGEIFDMVQSQSTTFGDTDVPTVVSVRPDSFFAAYDGQTGIVKGRCVVWDNLTIAQKRKVSEYMKERLWINEDGDLTFTCIRQRSVVGAGNGNWGVLSSESTAHLRYSNSVQITAQGNLDVAPSFGTGGNGHYVGNNSGLTYDGIISKGAFPVRGASAANVPAYNGRCFFYVLGTQSRINEGAFAKGVNESGGMAFSDGNKWSSTVDSYATQLECFQNAHATLSGRDDDRLPQYVYADGLGGVVDYRYSAYPMSSPEESAKAWEKFEGGTYRGVELVGSVSLSGDYEYRYEELTGGLVSLPVECLSSTVTCAHTADGGVTWTRTTPAVDLIDNTVTLPVGGESVVSFTAKAKQLKTTTNKTVLNASAGLLGVVVTQNHTKSTLAEAVAGIILKSDASGIMDEQSTPSKYLIETTLSRVKTLLSEMDAPTNNSQAVKLAVYQISENGQVNLGVVANTMSHNGTDWGELEEIMFPASGLSDDTFVDGNTVTQTCHLRISSIPLGWTHNHARVSTQVDGVDL